jgi:glycosyltransferase involved in cell wall biosynthesis
VLVGTGPKGIVGTLKNMINCARIEDRVLFTGTVPFADMPRYVASFDAAVVPQDKAEPHRSPIKLYEYMASGKPIVAADVGQIAEIITDGENGLLYDADSPKQLAEKITLLKGDAHLRRRLASSARSDAEAKHSWTSRASLILDSLHRCTINKKDNG